MKTKEPSHSKDPMHEASSSLTSTHRDDYEDGTNRPRGNHYEVFLSFRGKDTRKGITDFLYTSLVDAGIQVFRDDNELRVGEEIGPELLSSITQSMISIPIISENYVSSKWCLHELAHMLKCKRSRGQIVLPIFYKVQPSHLRSGLGDAINAHKKNLDEMVVKEWEETLKEVTSMKGWESEKIDNGHEGTLVKIIVRKVMGEIKRLFQLDVPQQLIGIDDHVEQIMSKINAKFNDTMIIGIYGMGGIGKTTLAKVLYNKSSSQFADRSFVANIRETSQHEGVKKLQKQLISDIMGSSCDLSNVDEGVSIIKSRFTSKKVLVLLDDMDDSTHLNALVGDGSWFGEGSIVIITTRNKSILDEARAGYMFPLNELSKDQSMILFSRHAFRKDSPQDDYEVISHDVVSLTRGLPIALEVIGSFLCGKEEEVWKDTLKKLRKVPDKKVQEKLKISYKALDDEEQQIFLDIACFFIGSQKVVPIYMWDACGFFPGRGIEVLVLRSLIKIDEYGKILMHDQLRDLGREIVRLESPKEPQERSRLWSNEEALDVLENKGTRKIEALCLGKCGTRRRCTAEQLKEMTNLRFLQVNGANFTGDFRSLLPKLRWLQWEGCPSDFDATNFHAKELVILNLSFSAISENWGGWIPLKMATKLKVLNLTGCRSLRRTPNLSAFESLDILILGHCENLEEIYPSIGGIMTLVSLDVGGCHRLKELPAGIGRMVELRELIIKGTDIQGIPVSSGCLMKLESLEIYNCIRFAQLPKSMGSLVSLTKLEVYTSEITELPESIGSMKKLKRLYLDECTLLARIPGSIGDLASLQHLILYHCSSLTEIPDWIGKLTSLTKLCLLNTSITKFPESIGNLQNLTIFEIRRMQIRELPDSIGTLAKLEKLFAAGCSDLERLPSNICGLVSLVELVLSESGISGLPESISKLSSLQTLHLKFCENLRELPELPSGLTALTISCQVLPWPRLSQLTGLKELGLSDCSWLEYLPELPLGLSKLSIIRSRKLKGLTNLSNLRHLSFLLLNVCFDLTEVTGLEGSRYPSNLNAWQWPEISRTDGVEDSSKIISPKGSQLDGLLDLSSSKISQGTNAANHVNSVIQGLSGSKSSQVSDILKCTAAGKLLVLSSFKYLSTLLVFNCENIIEIHGLDGSESLRKLEVSHCSSLGSLDLSNLKNLQYFRCMYVLQELG